MNRVREERKKILAAGIRQVLDEADRAGRQTLTRAEQKQISAMESELDGIVAAVRHEDDQRRNFDPRSAQGTQRIDDYEAGSTLAPEERLADWARGRGGDPLSEGERLSLGAIVQARVRGDHRHLTDVERRVMAEGTDAAGGVLVPEILSAKIIDRARSQAVVIQAGAVTVPMASDELVLARLATGNTATWHAENAADITASDQVWERVELKAKTLVVEQKMSAELMEDLSDQGRRAIEHEIAQAIGLLLDRACLEGDPAVDANSPRGIAATTGVQSVSMGANGLKPTSYDQIVQALFAVKKQNAADPTAAILHPRDGETFALLKDTTLQPLRKPPAIETLPTLSSSQLATNRTQGTNSDASNAYVGDFRQLLIGVRPTLQLRFQILRERYATPNLQVAFLAWLRADVALAHPEHFAKIIGIRNA